MVPGSNFYEKNTCRFCWHHISIISYHLGIYTIKIHRSTSQPKVVFETIHRIQILCPQSNVHSTEKKRKKRHKEPQTTCEPCDHRFHTIQKRSRDRVCCQCPDFSSALIASIFVGSKVSIPILESSIARFQLRGSFLLGTTSFFSHKETKNW